MRTTDERMNMLKQRTAEIRYQQKVKRERITMVCSVCLCLFLIAGLSLLLPGIRMDWAINGTEILGAGSIFQSTEFMKFVVLGVASFVLGCAVTLFCVLLHRRSKEKGDND